MSLRDIFTAVFLQQNNSNKFSPGVYSLSNLRFLVTLTISCMIPSHGMGLKHNGKVVCYCHNMCATLAPAYFIAEC